MIVMVGDRWRHTAMFSRFRIIEKISLPNSVNSKLHKGRGHAPILQQMQLCKQDIIFSDAKMECDQRNKPAVARDGWIDCSFKSKIEKGPLDLSIRKLICCQIDVLKEYHSAEIIQHCKSRRVHSEKRRGCMHGLGVPTRNVVRVYCSLWTMCNRKDIYY